MDRPQHPQYLDSESAAFHLPLLGLYADLEAGCGSVRLPDEFAACSPAIQVEILGDWMRALAQLRRQALLQLYRTLCDGMPQLGPGEKLARFRSTCDALGIEVPPDFASMLTSA